MKVTIIPCDLSHNCLGRAYILAKVLSGICEVEIVGFSLGGGVWEPLRKELSEIGYKYFSGGKTFFRFLPQIKDMLKIIDGDVIYAMKPRTTSFGVGLLSKIMFNRPLILDIDDWEVGFYLDKGFKSILFTPAFLWNLDALPYTIAMELLVKWADDITVASRYLQRKFGGHYVPHCVDTNLFDPLKYNREKEREKLGIGDEKIVSFIGTPQPHKGLEDLVEALSLVKNDVRVKFMMTGNPKEPYVQHILTLSKRKLGKDNILFLGIRPKSEEPLLLSITDLVVLPQKTTKFAMAQTPAKVFSAMAMAKPIVATKISDLPEILKDCGILVKAGDIIGLAKAISLILKNDDLAKEMGKKARKKCIKKYSWDSAQQILKVILKKFQ